MKRINLFLLSLLFSTIGFSQDSSKFSIEINFGIQGNFFVRSYEEVTGLPYTNFYNKNFVGTVGGLELKYPLNRQSSIGFAYARSINRLEVNYSGNFVNVDVKDFHITHINNFYQLFYERAFKKNVKAFSWHAGVFYLRMQQQEIEVAEVINGGALFEERNFKSNNLEEIGAFVGLSYSKAIDTKFDLGIKTRFYYLISTNSAEAITLTPTLTYHFN